MSKELNDEIRELRSKVFEAEYLLNRLLELRGSIDSLEDDSSKELCDVVLRFSDGGQSHIDAGNAAIHGALDAIRACLKIEDESVEASLRRAIADIRTENGKPESE